MPLYDVIVLITTELARVRAMRALFQYEKLYRASRKSLSRRETDGGFRSGGGAVGCLY